MNLNMEMGLLVSGGDLPGLVEKHFEELILNGTLNEVSLYTSDTEVCPINLD